MLFLPRQKQLSDRGGCWRWAAVPSDSWCRTGCTSPHWGMVRRKKRCSGCHSQALTTATFACVFFHQMLLRLHVHFGCLLWLSQAALSCHKACSSPITDQTHPLFRQSLAMMPSSWSWSSHTSSLPFPFLVSHMPPAPELQSTFRWGL